MKTNSGKIKGRVSHWQPTWDWVPTFDGYSGDAGSTGGTTTGGSNTGGSNTGGNSGKFTGSDIASIIGSAGSTIAGVVQGIFQKPAQNNTYITGGGTEEKSNTGLYIGIGAGVLVLVLVLILALRK